MSLWVCIKSIKDNNRELSMYQSRGTYSIKYEHENQEVKLKSNITDIGYANYLFDMFVEDLHMKENSLEHEDIYNINYFKGKIDKHHKSLIENKYEDNHSRINRRSADISRLIELQSKITDIILKDYGKFKISKHRVKEFIDNQQYLRQCIGEKDYLTTSYGNKLNKYFKSIDTLYSEKFKIWSDKNVVKMFDEEIERVKQNLEDEVEMLLSLDKDYIL